MFLFHIYMYLFVRLGEMQLFDNVFEKAVVVFRRNDLSSIFLANSNHLLHDIIALSHCVVAKYSSTWIDRHLWDKTFAGISRDRKSRFIKLRRKCFQRRAAKQQFQWLFRFSKPLACLIVLVALVACPHSNEDKFGVLVNTLEQCT